MICVIKSFGAERERDFINRLYINRINDRITVQVAVYGYLFLCLRRKRSCLFGKKAGPAVYL